jgi:hypothetical protein
MFRNLLNGVDKANKVQIRVAVLYYEIFGIQEMTSCLTRQQNLSNMHFILLAMHSIST